MMAGPRAITLLLAIAVWAGQTPPQFKTRTELVQVDVVVLDASGRPVRGLQASDFTILDRRRPQAIQTFTEISHERVAGAEPRLPSDSRLAVADNVTARSQRAIVLVIHDLGLWIGRTDRVKETARRVVNDLGPEASMALLFSSGRGGVEFTENRAELLNAIDRFEGAFYANRRGHDHFIRTIEDAARHLRSDHTRRKAIVTISEGIAGDFLGLFELMRPRAGKGHEDMAMLAMMDALRRSNIALYGIDPRGRLQTTEERARESRNTNPALRMFDSIYHSQQSLELTAEASGGFAIVDTNEFDAGLSRIVADLDNYYLLGFHSQATDDNRWHDIEVTVNRPGFTVRHRKGYGLDRKLPKSKNKDPMVRLSEGVLPVTDLRLRLSARTVTQSPKSAKVDATLEILDPASTAETAADRISVTLLVVDLKRKKAVRRIDRAGSTTFSISIDLPPGSYQLRASARSARSGNGGSVYLTIEVPTG